jgi:hypothetical protein
MAVDAEVSAQVIGIWRAVLHTEQVGAGDNFFSLGGTSHAALQIVMHVHGALGVEVPFGIVFKHPTLAALIDAVAELSAAAAVDAAPATPASVADARAADDPVPVSLLQDAALLAESSEADHGFLSWVYQLNGRLNIAALAVAIDDVVARHAILRTRFVRGDTQWYQVVTPFAPQVLQIIDHGGQPKLAGLNASVAHAETIYRGLSALEDPRFQALLYTTLDPKTSVLAVFVAQAVVDSDSGPLVAAEISRAYAAHTGQSEPLGLPAPIDVSYLDHVASHPIDAAAIQRAREHWARLSRSVPAMSGWPQILREDPVSCAFEVPPPAWAELVRAMQASGTTTYVFVLASFQVALARLVGLSHFSINSTISDRRDPVTERMIGNFQSPVRIELRVDDGDRFADVIARTSASVAEAVTHCAVPPSPVAAPVPAITFHMFDYHEGPMFTGTRRRRFRLHDVSRAPLRLNCIRGPNGRQDFVLSSATAPQDLLSRLAAAVRAVLEAAVIDPRRAVSAFEM